MVSYAGADSGGQWYKAWGETRLTTGAIPTKYQYTGQYNQVILGLYYYGARWYDAALSRWTQPDILIPNPSNSSDYDRYSYARNNPVRYNDPEGYCTGDPNKLDSLTRDEKECWRLYNNMHKWYPNVFLSGHSIWNVHSLTNLLIALRYAKKAFGGRTGFSIAVGTFTIYGPSTFWAMIAQARNAPAITPPNLQLIALTAYMMNSSDFVYLFLHELGHLFDFHTRFGGSSYLSSTVFVNRLGLTCNSPKILGCASDSSNLYPEMSTGSGYNPTYGETTQYGMENSIEDFAESFVRAVLVINNAAIPTIYKNISQSRKDFLLILISNFSGNSYSNSEID